MMIFAIGSSLTSCYWNGAATYYRGIYRNLHRLGYEITFAQPDIYNRQQHQDLDVIDYARVLVYSPPHETTAMLREASKADVVIKHSGIGAEDELLERAVLELRSQQTRVIFWDVDAPATLARLEHNPGDPFRSLIPQYDFVLTYGGGKPVTDHYLRFGARTCFPIYNGLDPETHYPVPAAPEFTCDLVFVGNRLPDREHRVEEFFLRAASLAPEMKFILAGEGWQGKPLPENVRWIGHLSSNDHNRVNCSARMVLNINRESMAGAGFSPPTRIFEAAGAAACVITDSWPGIDEFFQPGREILVANSAEDVVGRLRTLNHEKTRLAGRRARERALRDHCYSVRATQVDQILQKFALPAGAAA